MDLNLRDSEPASPSPEEPPVLSAAEREELQTLRGGQSFLRAFASGRYIFRPLADGARVELRWVHGAESRPFEPPCIVEV